MTCFIRIVFFVAVSLKLVTFKKFLQLTFFFDPIAIPMTLSIYAYCLFFYNAFELNTLEILSMVSMSLLFVLCATFHRIIMLEIRWRKWQLISYKISLGVATGVYCIWGLYFIFPGISWTNGKNP